jgi:SAM-dependent methyltransferase
MLSYRAAIRVLRPIGSMPAGTTQHVQVEVTNLGDEWWPRGPDPEPAIFVGHRWRRADGTEDLHTPRTALTEAVAPGATARLSVAIQAPLEAGPHELGVDMVHEWVRWFDCADVQEVDVTPPYGDEFFAAIAAGAREAAAAVLPKLFELVPVRSVVDVGCGTGGWLSAARDLGVEDLYGVDGPWLRPEDAEIPSELVTTADLSEPYDFGRRFDLALSLEVAEHLPETAARVFVATLVGAAPIVAFSAAVPAQGGTGHLNEQWPAYWTDLFAEHGYEPLDCLRPLIWDDERVEWWYAQNLILFGRPEAFDRLPALADDPRRGARPLALIHPRARPVP